MFVAIHKRVKDLTDKTGYEGLPEDYPVECAECASLEQAQEAYPDAQIMPVEQYKGYAEAMGVIWAHNEEQKAAQTLAPAKKSFVSKLKFW